MTTNDRDPHPDSMPGANHDSRDDLTQGTSGRNSDLENVVEGGSGGVSSTGQTPLEPTGVPDGNAGTGGVTKNQDDTAQ